MCTRVLVCEMNNMLKCFLVYVHLLFAISIQGKTISQEVTPKTLEVSDLPQSEEIKSTEKELRSPSRFFNESLQNGFRVVQLPRRYFEKSSLLAEVNCRNESIFGVEVVVSTDSQTNVSAFRKIFRCPSMSSNAYKANLVLPRYVAYKPSHLNKYSVYVESATLRCWLLDQKLYESVKNKSLEYFGSSASRFESLLEIQNPYDRPARYVSQCLQWTTEQLARLPYAPKCGVESEVVEAITFPVALSGFMTGVHRTFDPYKDKTLRNLQLQSRGKPEFTIVIWLYIEEYCPSQKPYCSILQHITWDDKFATPQILINNRGQIFVELITESCASIFHLSDTNETIPKYSWSKLVFACFHGQCNLSVSSGEDLKKQWMTSMKTSGSNALYFDDTMGLIVFGGSELTPSFKGYIGKASFYRRRVIRPEQTESLGNEDTAVRLELNQRHSKCRKYTAHVDWLMMQMRNKLAKALRKVTSPAERKMNPFYPTITDDPPIGDADICPEFQFHKLLHYDYVYRLVKEYIYSGRPFRQTDIADELYFYAEFLLGTKGVAAMELIISLLKQSSCLGNHDATFMLSVILNYGLTLKSNEIQSHSYLMYGALEGNRLCLLSLGNKHVYSIDGFTLDENQAYVYFKSVADMTNEDFEVHKRDDVYTEMVRLTNDFEVKEQTEEDGDIIYYLKMQANQGVLLAQKRLARMYYWGSGGVARDVQVAFKYYQMAASSGDPSSLYDYGIVLLKGHGTAKNLSLAIEVLKKSADQGFAQAMNTIGWYALEVEKNATKAEKFFFESHELGNKDASYNLAHMHLKGKFPNSSVDKVLAWDYIAAGALRGQRQAGILVGMYNLRGHPKIDRNINLAIGWVRYIAEQNPGIGRLLQKGLKSYKDTNWFTSLVYYLMSATTGVEVANFNLAYLCDEDKGGFVRYVDKECKWRHYNLSTQRSPKDVDPYAWNRMAHYYYYHGVDGRRDTQAAVKFYFNAAIKGDPQGLYNLAILIEEGVQISEYHLNSLLVPNEFQPNKFLLVVHLLMRCQDARHSEAYLPCTAALYRVVLLHYFNFFRIYLEAIFLATAVGTAVIFAVHSFYRRYNRPVM